MATTIILAGMMMVFWMSVFPPVVHFGLLLAVGLAGALLATLVLDVYFCDLHLKAPVLLRAARFVRFWNQQVFTTF